MEKVLLVIVAFVVGIILVGAILPGAILTAVTDDYSENFSVVTGVGETEAICTLEYGHYLEDLTDLTSSSDNVSDSPAVMDYNTTTKQVTIDGLVSEDSRILTINYVREGNQQFGGVNAFLIASFTLLILGLIGGAVWRLFKG